MTVMMENKFNHFSDYLNDLRKKRKITLREFCKRAGADAANISRLERGGMAPPQSRIILERYASVLELKEGTDDWYLFFDLAAADRGMIPEDIMSDEELAKSLPAFFRTLRGQKPTSEEMRKIADKIREDG